MRLFTVSLSIDRNANQSKNNMITRFKLIEGTLELAQKYNDFIDANELKLTKYDLLSLHSNLNKKNKSQVESVNQSVMKQYIYIKNLYGV